MGGITSALQNATSSIPQGTFGQMPTYPFPNGGGGVTPGNSADGKGSMPSPVNSPNVTYDPAPPGTVRDLGYGNGPPRFRMNPPALDLPPAPPVDYHKDMIQLDNGMWIPDWSKGDRPLPTGLKDLPPPTLLPSGGGFPSPNRVTDAGILPFNPYRPGQPQTQPMNPNQRFMERNQPRPIGQMPIPKPGNAVYGQQPQRGPADRNLVPMMAQGLGGMLK